MNRVRLGQDVSSTAQVVPVDSTGLVLPSLTLDSNLLLIGAGAVVLALVFRDTGRHVSRYSKRRKSRAERRRALKAELASL